MYLLKSVCMTWAELTSKQHDNFSQRSAEFNTAANIRYEIQKILTAKIHMGVA